MATSATWEPRSTSRTCEWDGGGDGEGRGDDHPRAPGVGDVTLEDAEQDRAGDDDDGADHLADAQVRSSGAQPVMTWIRAPRFPTT